MPVSSSCRAGCVSCRCSRLKASRCGFLLHQVLFILSFYQEQSMSFHMQGKKKKSFLLPSLYMLGTLLNLDSVLSFLCSVYLQVKCFVLTSCSLCNDARVPSWLPCSIPVPADPEGLMELHTCVCAACRAGRWFWGKALL